jgi:oligopeptide/dipeptide ABC transporter ATP-binding protein
MGLLPKNASIDRGSAIFDGTDLCTADEAAFRRIRGLRIGMVFQDPMSALNPYLTIGTQLTEALIANNGMERRAAVKAAIEELEAVGIADAPDRMKQHPHQFSGGQRQRILIAMTLLQRPDILITDEATTALDVTLQAQILDLLRERQDKLGTAMIVITHNFGVAASVCDDVLVMYAGSVVECGRIENVLKRPAHPYTAALKSAIPSGKPGEILVCIPGAPPDPVAQMTGCRFAPRCQHATPECRCEACPLCVIYPGHQSACLRVRRGEVAL